MKRLFTSAGLALALVGAPVAAQAADSPRATAPVEQANSIEGASTLLLVALAVALGVGLFLLIDDNNSDSP